MKSEIHRAREIKQRFQRILAELAAQDATVEELKRDAGEGPVEATALEPLAQLFEDHTSSAPSVPAHRPINRAHHLRA